MITFLKGQLVENLTSHVSINVHGVGYEVIMPLRCVDRLGKPGDQVTILTHFHVREQEQTLYGFLDAEERDLFRLLIDRVSGVGPKVALSVLSGMSAVEFKAFVIEGDAAAIGRVKGLGKKTAERIVLELKDKVGVAAAWEAASAAAAPTAEQTRQTDAVLALISLGFKQAEAAKAVTQTIKESSAELSVEELIRTALRRLQ